ncbi:type II secretion protein F [Janibacter sp. Soil728]|uniref:type II secretion system F family protein n=1 Tax=Janibacter sp. Soil728 TaxID=1736393 RepID=UPI0006F39872|nr:type II secretion system F family protein [Janibacter sp. Soil728]KRE39440.1 type II secretion protein F [Janibacter sp. Soil728]
MKGAGRLLATIGLGLAVVLLGAAPAGAATKVSISDVASAGQDLTGVLTFRSEQVVQVDNDSLKATVDGEDRPASVSSSTSIKRTAMLVIDTSGSMGAEGMTTVREATRTYLAEAPDDVRVGVATFADTAGVDLAPTTDRAKAQRVVDGLASRGDTSLYAGVTAAAKVLGASGDRSMVLLSDGADTISTAKAADRKRATQALRTQGIRVDVVRFKTDDPDASTALRGFARAGGGSVIAAADAQAVGAAFKTSARALRSQAKFLITTPQQLTGSHLLRLEGTTGGTPFVVEQTVDLGGGGGAVQATGAVVDGQSGTDAVTPIGAASLLASPWPWLGAMAVAAAVFLMSAALFVPRVQTRRELRVAGIEGYVLPSVVTRADNRRSATPFSQRLVDAGERQMEGRRSTPRTMQLIARADLPLRAGEWFVLCALAVIVGVMLGLVLVPGPWLLGAVLGLVIGISLPQLVLRFLASRRAKAFERVLPQSLILVATTLKSGFGLPQALAAVAQDSPAPVDKEFSRALAETRIGTDIADALERVAERMGSDAMHMAIMAIRIQRDVGGNLAETIETTARTLRDREILERQVAALSAEGRLSAQILIALPICLFFYMLLVNYDYVSLLWTTTLGILMSVGAIVMLIIGVFWMRRVIRIEV